MNVQNMVYLRLLILEQNRLLLLVNRTENEDKRARVLALASASYQGNRLAYVTGPWKYRLCE